MIIAGGLLDPNLQSIVDAANNMGIDWFDLRQPVSQSLPFHWDLSAAYQMPWGTSHMPRSAFLRCDVFAMMQDARVEVQARANGYFISMQGWLYSHPEVKIFNRDLSQKALNKPAALFCAQSVGLTIPRTLLSNDIEQLKRLNAPHIVKPVAGGGRCGLLGDALQGEEQSFSAMPALVQPQLVSPEVRIFIVGQRAFAFLMSSPSLDYRVLQDVDIQLITPPALETSLLMDLMKLFNMDFGAADFKTDPLTGNLVFLELNTSPMFARFNRESGDLLCREMVSYLNS